MVLQYVLNATGEQRVKDALNKGYQYYLKNFFLSDGTVKYYHNKTEPLDVHAFANAVIFLVGMDSHRATPQTLVHKVVDQMISKFWNPKGYFYWQKKRGIMYKLPCMRWVQSWALLALASYLTLDTKQYFPYDP